MNRMNLYPNMYIFLIAAPGVGKTVSGAQTEILWRSLEHHHVAPTNASKAALIDVLAESRREIILPKLGGHEEFHALNIMSGEFGAFMPTWDGEFMNTLVTLWDGGRYTERKRGGDLRIDIPQPSLNMLACATPDFMVNWMPEGAWKQGFASRLLLIYSGEVVLGDLWSEDNHANAMGPHYNGLQSDLKVIGNLYGKMEFTEEASSVFTKWYRGGMPTVPDHPKLESYITRRPVHLAKICMVRAASMGRMLIELSDYQWGLDTLMEAEAYMPDVFTAMTGGKGQSAAMDDLWHFCFVAVGKEGKPIDQRRVVNFLRERVPTHSVMQTLELMVRGGLLLQSIGPAGNTLYAPAPKERRF
jgi:hypothetical protein